MNKRGDPEFCYACLVNPNSNFEKISGKCSAAEVFEV
jgi:hypothetical protein